MTTIGVVIPAYRAEAWIGEALASVAGQGRAADQVVVVDDASPDGTAAAAAEWAGRLPLIVITQATNGGPGAARREGIAHLTTDLVALLDADDVWLPDHLTVMEDAHRACPGLVSASALRWVPGQATARRGVPDAATAPPGERQLAAMLERDFVFSGTVFARSLHDEVGGFRPFHGTEDWDLWLRMVAAGATVSVAPVPTVLHRVHPGSLSAAARLVAEEIRVVETFLAEHAVDAESEAVARRTIRRLRANTRLQQSYVEAREGRRWSARAQAVRALAGTGPTRLYAAAMVGAPSLAVSRRDRLHEDAAWQVSR